MKYIEPAQFLGILLAQQELHDKMIAVIKVREFNKMTRELVSHNIRIRFGYSDFIAFAETFSHSIQYKDYALHVPFSKNLKDTVNRYNNIYSAIADKYYKTPIWEDYLK